MQSAALGLSCHDAFAIFSQHETLALQKRVSELETRLRRYEPIKSGVDMDAGAILRKVRSMFDSKNPPAMRDAPVPSKEHATHPLVSPSTSPWCRLNVATAHLNPPTSLQHCIQMVLLQTLGTTSAKYCRQEADNAIVAAQHALLGGYMAAQWTLFSVQPRQEYIVWQALLGHFAKITRDVAS